MSTRVDGPRPGAVARLRRARPRDAGGIAAAAAAGRLPDGSGPAIIEDAREAGDGWVLRETRHELTTIRGLHRAFASEDFDAGLRVAEAASFLGVRPRSSAAPARILFLDLETTGLGGSGTLAWCVGLARLETQRFVVEQFLLSDPAGEGEILARADERIAAADLVVTFNGRSFDLPLLDSRRVMQRARSLRPSADLDLLPAARRIFGSTDARLPSIERRIGRPRGEDIAGEDIPRAWFDWLRRGATGPIRRAVDHNREDLLAMVAVLSWLVAVAARDPGAEAMADPLGLVEIHLGRGDRDAALAALRASAPPPQGAQARRRARLARRLLGRAGSRPEWQRLVDARDPGALAWEMLAKILEHDDRNPAAALALVTRACSIVPAGLGSLRLARRKARLAARVAPVPLGGGFHVDCGDPWSVRRQEFPRELPGRDAEREPPGSEWRSSLSDTLSGLSPRSARS